MLDVVLLDLPPLPGAAFHDLIRCSADGLRLFARAINLLLVAGVQEQLPMPLVLFQVALFCVPHSDPVGKVSEVSAVEVVHLVATLLVHRDDDASLLLGDEWVLVLWVDSLGV